MSTDNRFDHDFDDTRTVPFVLPNGQAVVLGYLRKEDYNLLNQWVKTEYMKNVSTATADMNPIDKQDFRLAALSHAAKLTFQLGEGRDILFGSSYGVSRMVYQLIQNPPLPFEEFNKLLYPNGFITLEGMDVVNAMLDALYGPPVAPETVLTEENGERPENKEILNEQ